MIGRFLRAVSLLSLFALVGCASSYNCYPCGKVNCDYCPPKPLPYLDYQSCNCNDSIGQAYLTTLSTPEYQKSTSEMVPRLDYEMTVSDGQNEANDEKPESSD